MKNIVLTIAAFLLFASAAFAQGSIEGTITDVKGNGLASVTVTVVGANAKPVAATTTDEDGNYTFDELSPGKYKVTANGTAAFQPATRENVNVAEDETTKLDITLAVSVLAPLQKPQPKSPAPQPMTVDEIIARHVTAIGGRDVIGRIQSVYMETILEVMGNETKGSVTILNGKGYRSESDILGGKMIQCFNEKGGWVINFSSGDQATVLPDELYKSGKGKMYVGGALFDFAAKGSKAELLGKEGNLYKIKLTTRDTQVSTYYIDSSTYLVNKQSTSGEMTGSEVEIIVSYHDYKKTDFGFVFPYTTETELGSFTQVTRVTKIEINKPVDPKIFEMPK